MCFTSKFHTFQSRYIADLHKTHVVYFIFCACTYGLLIAVCSNLFELFYNFTVGRANSNESIYIRLYPIIYLSIFIPFFSYYSLSLSLSFRNNSLRYLFQSEMRTSPSKFESINATPFLYRTSLSRAVH